MGLFEAAHGGTLFLDELPSLPQPLQAKLLMVLEDHRIRRLGGNRFIPVDVRIIAASNRDLKQLVNLGQFREDLYHRLDLCRVYLPPLRGRPEEITLLAEILMKRLCQRHRLPVRQITPAGQQRLWAYRWPGNVRELAHELERAIIFEDSAELNFEHLTAGTESRRMPEGEDQHQAVLPPDQWFNEKFTFPPEGFLLEEAINHLIHHALKQTNNNVSAAARLLGATRDYVRYRLNNGKE
jgi:DNA-binding NtrC family response regulator